MMSVRTAALLSAGFLLLLTRGALTNEDAAFHPILVSVVNDLSNLTPESHYTSVVEGGVLLGALRRLQETQHAFKFTVKEDPHFGLLLESVNGVAGNEQEQTYWEILSESSGELSRLDVEEDAPHGVNLMRTAPFELRRVGCYRPKADEHIILRFSTWEQ